MKKIAMFTIAASAVLVGGLGVAQASVINDKLDTQQIASACDGVTGPSVDTSIALKDGSTLSGTVMCDSATGAAVTTTAAAAAIPSVDLTGIKLGDDGIEGGHIGTSASLMGANVHEGALDNSVGDD